MNASELRIGNWVNSIAGGLRGGYGIVRGIEGEGALIMLKQGHLKPLASELLCGIPLTEEILLKAGHVLMGGCAGSGEIKIGNWVFEVNTYTTKTCTVRYNVHLSSVGITFPCEYLHQLQNLYFALTGEELKIEL